MPSCAVTTILMALLPTFNETEDGEPEITILPFTLTVALLSLVVGVIFQHKNQLFHDFYLNNYKRL